MNYLNEFDGHAAEWSGLLADHGLIPPCVIDRRSIHEVQPEDLEGYAQCHFFAGIGGWAEALRLAGWPETAPVWSGSAPCQPYSSAGKGEGDADARNLWPEMFRLIRQCRPQCVFGEQVSSAIGHGWLDGISADLGGEGYACGAVVLGGGSVGAPHKRSRLYWVADLQGVGWEQRVHRIQDGEERAHPGGGKLERVRLSDPADGGKVGKLGVPVGEGLEGHRGDQGPQKRKGEEGPTRQAGQARGVGNSGGKRLEGRTLQLRQSRGGQDLHRLPPPAGGGAVGFWDDYELLACADGTVRRTQPGLFPLVDGISFRLSDGRTRKVSRAKVLKGIGNAIIPQVAAVFIRAYMEAKGMDFTKGEGIIVCGSRGFRDYDLLSKTMDRLTTKIPEFYVLSGAAEGADSLGERWAWSRWKTVRRFHPDYEKYGKKALLARSMEMLNEGVRLVAFDDGKDKDVADVIAKARRAGLKVKVIRV